MKISVIGGNGNSFLSDLKARVTLNHFEGDSILASVYPSLFNTNSSGQYELSGDVGASSDVGKLVSKVEIESNQLAYYLGALGLIVAALIYFAFKK
jgi:hypothetical protein